MIAWKKTGMASSVQQRELSETMCFSCRVPHRYSGQPSSLVSSPFLQQPLWTFLTLVQVVSIIFTSQERTMCHMIQDLLCSTQNSRLAIFKLTSGFLSCAVTLTLNYHHLELSHLLEERKWREPISKTCLLKQEESTNTHEVLSFFFQMD